MFSPNDLVRDRYRVVRLLGVRGEGASYEALDERTGETVTLVVSDRDVRVDEPAGTGTSESRTYPRLSYGGASPRRADAVAPGERAPAGILVVVAIVLAVGAAAGLLIAPSILERERSPVDPGQPGPTAAVRPARRAVTAVSCAPAATIAAGGRVASIVVSSDRVAALGIDGIVREWDADGVKVDGAPPRDGVARVTSIAADGGRVTVGCDDGFVRMHYAGEGRAFLAHDAAVTAIAFAADGATLVTGGADGTLKLWRAGETIPTRALVVEGRVAAVSPDARFAAVLRHDALDVIATADRSVRASVPVHGLATPAAVFSPDGDAAIVVTDGVARVVRTADGSVALELRAPSRATCAAWGADGRLAAVGAADGAVTVWSTEGGRLLASGQGTKGAVSCISLGSDGRHLATGGADGSVRVWSVRVEE